MMNYMVTIRPIIKIVFEVISIWKFWWLSMNRNGLCTLWTHIINTSLHWFYNIGYFGIWKKAAANAALGKIQMLRLHTLNTSYQHFPALIISSCVFWKEIVGTKLSGRPRPLRGIEPSLVTEPRTQIPVM